MLPLIKRIITNETGASAAEYAVLTGLILAAIIAGIALFAGNLGSLFSTLGTYMGSLAGLIPSSASI
jgi:pilus assembly protein Flp/PilA